MREIKFRGREVIGNQRKLGGWVFGDLVHYCGGYERTVDDEITPVVTEICIECADCLINVDPSTVGQFTGMKDSSGREIYEGDILSLREGSDEMTKVIDFYAAITALDLSEMMNLRLLEYYFERGEVHVIGNIYDNPELLEAHE